jgi:alpha-glucosidase
VAVAAHAGFSKAEPWLPVDPEHAELAVDRQERDPASTLNTVRRLIALRHAHAALRTGGMTLLDAPEDAVVFQRGEGGEALLCAFNLGFEPAPWTLPAGWRVVDGVNLGPGDALPPLAGLVAARV